jgi:hypothetical protein
MRHFLNSPTPPAAPPGALGSWLGKTCSQLRILPFVVTGMAGFATKSNAQTTIFSENMGIPTGTTAIATYANNTAPATFQNKGSLTFTGTGDMRVTGVSSTYPGFSGGGNVFLTSPGPREFQIAGINTSSFGSFTLSFGVSRSNVSQTLSELSLEYSSDGTNYVAVTVPTQPAASGWIKLTLENLSLPSTPNLRLKWRNNSTAASGGQQIRLDDVTLIGAGGTDITAPALSAISPINGSTNASITGNLVATFNEPVRAGTGVPAPLPILLKKTSDNSTIPATVTISGTTLTIDPTANLLFSTGYYVVVPSGSVEDLAGNPFGGIPETSTWAFTTLAEDGTPPVATLSPADNATAVMPASNLVISYNEPVQLGAGTISLRKVSGNVLVEEFNVASSTRVTLSGTSLTINPTQLLEPDTDYYVAVPAGVVTDPAANGSAAIAAVTGWNFKTRALPNVVISQYYEGAGLDRYIELTNLTAAPLTLSGYRLTVWSNSPAGANEAWKSGTGTTDRVVLMDGITIPASGTILIANTGAVAPAYAANSANYKDSVTEVVTFFSGDDSVVLYSGATNAFANVVDAVSFIGNQGENTSFYRVGNIPAFTDVIGSSIVDDLGLAWQQIATALVDTATINQPYYLLANSEPNPPVLNSFTLGNGATISATPRVTLNFTRTGGVPLDYMVSTSPDFTGAVWTTLPGSIPVTEVSAGDGEKTLYFKLRNASGESNVLSDSITRSSTITSGPVLISQYYEGTSNNKYVELTNVSQSTVSLAEWTIVRWGNTENQNWKVTGFAPGSASGSISLAGTLAAGQTVVLANSGAAAPITAGNAFISSSVINHTGDDSFVLYQGTVAPENLRDAASFTVANEGPNTSFVRIAPGAGFDFDAGTSLETYPLIWSEFTLAVVDAAVAGVNEHLGTYPGGIAADYDGWIDGFFPGVTDPLVIGFDADPDGDGVRNGVEALSGGIPNSAGVFAITELTQSGNTLTFVYPQARAIPSGVTASYEWSTDLINWYTTGQSNGVNTVTLAEGEYNNDGVSPLIDYQVTATVTAGTAPKLFVRVKALQP